MWTQEGCFHPPPPLRADWDSEREKSPSSTPFFLFCVGIAWGANSANLIELIPTYADSRRRLPEPDFLNFYGAKEWIPRDQYRQPL